MSIAPPDKEQEQLRLADPDGRTLLQAHVDRSILEYLEEGRAGTPKTDNYDAAELGEQLKLIPGLEAGKKDSGVEPARQANKAAEVSKDLSSRDQQKVGNYIRCLLLFEYASSIFRHLWRAVVVVRSEISSFFLTEVQPDHEPAQPSRHVRCKIVILSMSSIREVCRIAVCRLRPAHVMAIFRWAWTRRQEKMMWFRSETTNKWEAHQLSTRVGFRKEQDDKLLVSHVR